MLLCTLWSTLDQCQWSNSSKSTPPSLVRESVSWRISTTLGWMTVSTPCSIPKDGSPYHSERYSNTLEDLTQQGIMTRVEKPIPQISSMVVVPKKNGTLHICLDPQDLKHAIQREHYPLTTNDRRCGYTTTWSQSIHSARCEKGVLACRAG